MPSMGFVSYFSTKNFSWLDFWGWPKFNAPSLLQYTYYYTSGAGENTAWFIAKYLY